MDLRRHRYAMFLRAVEVELCSVMRSHLSSFYHGFALPSE